jgi:glycosyltransferase involved in cell wall biosynthesis
MRLILVSRYTFERHRLENAFFSPPQAAYAAYAIPLQLFDEVLIVAPYVDVEAGQPEHQRVAGSGVKVLGIPFALNNYFAKKKYIFRILSEHFSQDTVIMDQDASLISYIVLDFARRHNIPYAMKIVADPYDYFSKEAYRGWFRIFLRYYHYYKQRLYCYGADVVFYVTKQQLQKKYPTKGKGFSMSNVVLQEKDFVVPRSTDKRDDLKILWVGHYVQPSKGALVLLKALLMVIRKGHALQLTLIGDGDYKQECIAFTLKHNLQRLVRFLPELPHSPEFFNYFSEADMFVLPSFHEGLPRVLIEAMAKGLPCLAFDTGGISECLSSEALVYKKRPKELAEKIMQVMQDPVLRNRLAEESVATARQYQHNLLQAELRKGLQQLKEALTGSAASTNPRWK